MAIHNELSGKLDKECMYTDTEISQNIVRDREKSESGLKPVGSSMTERRFPKP